MSLLVALPMLQARSELSRNLFRLGPIGPLWAHKGPYGPIGPLWAHMGPYGPIRALMAHKGPILLKKSLTLMKNHKIINKNLKVVNLEIIKVKTWFGDKDLLS